MPRSRPDSDRPRRVRRTPEAARELILAAARGLIAEHGPDAVGLKDIGLAAGVSHTLVVHYFGGYDAVVQEVLREAIARFRAQILERMTSGAPLDPAGWVAIIFDSLRDRAASRLILWALLSGRFDGPDAFFRKEQGLRIVADALERRVAEVFGAAAPDRATLELTLVLGLSASWGYALGSSAIWGALGREPSRARDDAARDRLATALFATALHAAPVAATAAPGPTVPGPPPARAGRGRVRPKQ